MKFDKIYVCLDMVGCPNRCKHCWIGHWTNGKLTEEDLRYVAEQFRPFADCLMVDNWYREPDYVDDYRKRWDLCQELSDEHNEHYELASFWRLVRDESYADWLAAQGVKAVQLTLFGGEFVFFMHQGGCDGENEQFYDIWVTPEDVEKLPKRLVDWTLKHFGAESLDEVFGRPEMELYEELISDTSVRDLTETEPVFFVDQYLNVYPNRTAPMPYWCLGNLKTDSAEKVLENYVCNRSLAQRTRLMVPLCEMVKVVGDPASQRLFTKGDYIDYVLNQYCKRIWENKA